VRTSGAEVRRSLLAKPDELRTAKPCRPGRRCYGQAFAEMCASPTGRTASSIRGAREARRKVRLPGEHGISRPTIAQGRPCDRRHLYAAVRSLCATFSRSGPWVPAGTRPSLRPLGLERVERPGKTRAKRAARMRRRVCDVRKDERWSRAPDAAQRPCGALQSRGPCGTGVRGLWVPALRRNVGALRRVRDTRAQPSTQRHLDECGENASVQQKILCRRLAAAP
jgi:hypothetical protein